MLRPPPHIRVSEWAERHRILGSRASSEPGPWRTSRTPYLREVMDALSAVHAEWYGQVLSTRVWCAECGTHWRLDSAATCTSCDRSIGPCCLRDVRLARWRDGTRACPYCGEGVIVG